MLCSLTRTTTTVFGSSSITLLLLPSFQHFIAECSLNHLTVSGQPFSATLTAERLSGLDLKPKLLSRLSQIGGFECSIFKVFGDFNKALLNLTCLEIALQLFFQLAKLGTSGA